MGSGSNQRCFDLRFQVFSNLDWQFEVCPPAVAICDGQHNRALVCCSGTNVAHSPISRFCVSGHGAIVSGRLQRVAASLIMPIASWVRIDFIPLPHRFICRVILTQLRAIRSRALALESPAGFCQSPRLLLEIPRSSTRDGHRAPRSRGDGKTARRDASTRGCAT
jgi:hypothetical protein